MIINFEQSSSENNDSENADYVPDYGDESIDEDFYEETSPKRPKEPENLKIQRQRGDSTLIEKECIKVRQDVVDNCFDKKTCSANPIKKLVSKRKFRFNLDGFNLDLTYITNQIIAMGYPANNYEKIYRNSMEDVQNFFRSRHRDHFLIVNLCAERRYDHSYFNGHVAEFPFEDHQAPTMPLIYGLCETLDKFLSKSPQNVAAIHCKAGKGRTGVMICCYLLYSKIYSNSYDAMRYYGYMRTDNKKGVTIPSQIRYVIYFEKCLKNNWSLTDIPVKSFRLKRIRIVTIPNLNLDGICNPFLILENKNQKAIANPTKNIQKSDGYIDFELDLVVQDDIKVQFFNNGIIKKKQKMFSFWFNTSFLDSTGELVICKGMLDGAVKDRANKIYSQEMRVEVEGVFLQHPVLKNFDPNAFSVIKNLGSTTSQYVITDR